jgi:hypothetical protein
MVLKVESVRSFVTIVFMALLSVTLAPAQTAPPKQTPPQQSAFDAQTASSLLRQLSEALQGQSQKKFLALFDLDRMKDSGLFKEQVQSFFSQTISIRVHLNLGETAVEGDKATIAVEAQMEATPSNGGPTARRNDRLNFTVANSGGTWKFVELQPRSFFSLP